MGFWIFMLIMSALLPVVMIGFGCYFKKTAPKEINYLFGYRTTRSMKNRGTWEFAHKLLGKIWSALGWIILMLSVAVMLIFIGCDKDTVGNAGMGILYGQIAVLIGSIFPVEAALKKNFDDDGNKKDLK